MFDLGGVLFSEGKAIAIRHLADQFGYEPDLVRGIIYSPKSLELRKGLISDDEFWRWARDQLPPNYDPALIRNAWYEGYVLDEEIAQLIRRLRKRYQIVAFSGNIKSRVDFLESKYHFRRLFDKEIYSFDHHVTKPDKKFVEALVRELGSSPTELVYIDDNDRYAQPAREMGLRVLIYAPGQAEKLKRELAALGVVA
ncbi:MAG TPA: HAD-IA family hydrolase [Candidatus Eisenbacteria bacterium]|nr:HAD-IA family hydrolase [Candidatus Eisenbacteria bacterium]